MKKILFFLFAIAIASGIQAQTTLILNRNSIKIDGGKEYRINDSIILIDTVVQIDKIQLGEHVKNGKSHLVKIEQKKRGFVYIPNKESGGIKESQDIKINYLFNLGEKSGLKTRIYIDDTLRYIISSEETKTSNAPNILEGKTTLTFFKDSLKLTTPDTVITLVPKDALYSLPMDSLIVEGLILQKLNKNETHSVMICRKDSVNSVLFQKQGFPNEDVCNIRFTRNDTVVFDIDDITYTFVPTAIKTKSSLVPLWIFLLLLGGVAAILWKQDKGQTDEEEKKETQNDTSNQEDKPTNMCQNPTVVNDGEEKGSDDKKEGEEQKSVENEKGSNENSPKEGEDAGDAEAVSQQEQEIDDTTDTEGASENKESQEETTLTDISEQTKTGGELTDVSKLSISELLKLLSDKQCKDLRDESAGVWLGQTSADELYKKLNKEQRRELRGKVLNDEETKTKILEAIDITRLSEALKNKLVGEKSEMPTDFYDFVLARLRGDDSASKKRRINFIKDYFSNREPVKEVWDAVVARITCTPNAQEYVFRSDDKTFRNLIANEIANSVNSQSLVLPREWDALLDYLKQQTGQQNEDNKSQGGSTAPENNSNDLINQLENENAELKTANDKLEKEKEELNDELTETIKERDTAINERDTAINERDTAINERIAAKFDFESKEKELKSKNVKLNQELEQKKQKLADTQEQLNFAKNELTKTEGKLTTANTTLINTQSTLETTNIALGATREKLRTTKETLQKREEDLESANGKITNLIQQWVASMKGLRNELISLVPKGILDNSKQLYSGSHYVMTDMVDMMLSGRSSLKKFIDRFGEIKVDENTTSADIKQSIQNMILDELGGQNPGWIDILMRLYAYSKVYFLRDELARLGLNVDFVTTAAEHTLALMGQVGVYADIPNLFITAYDKSTYDLEPLKTIDQIVPSVSDHAVSGVVADVYRIGYHTENPNKHKNAIVSIY